MVEDGMVEDGMVEYGIVENRAGQFTISWK
jgi:hypothetical protein